MKNTFLIILLAFCMTSFAQNTHILPTPQSVEWQAGDFDWNKSNIALAYDRSNSEIDALAKRFSEEINATLIQRLNPQATVYKAPFLLRETDIDFIPRRTFLGTYYQGGLSDHLPIILDLNL